MKIEIAYLHCGDYLLKILKKEIQEVFNIIDILKWEVNYSYKNTSHQTAYNKKFEDEFKKFEWEPKPFLNKEPRLIGDFRKNSVFVEIQFGNSATIYRDFYKFQYGHRNGLLSLSILIVPTNPMSFFPSRVKSVSNIAEYNLAKRYFTILQIQVPTIIIGLLPKN